MSNIPLHSQVISRLLLLLRLPIPLTGSDADQFWPLPLICQRYLLNSEKLFNFHSICHNKITGLQLYLTSSMNDCNVTTKYLYFRDEVFGHLNKIQFKISKRILTCTNRKRWVWIFLPLLWRVCFGRGGEAGTRPSAPWAGRTGGASSGTELTSGSRERSWLNCWWGPACPSARPVGCSKIWGNPFQELLTTFP